MFTPIFLLVLLFCKTNAFQTDEVITWTLRNANGSINIPGTVPGGVYSDLANAKIIGDILYRFNDVLTRWVAHDTWTYEGKFEVSSDQLKYEVANLVLHGVDTVAFVELNDVPVLSTNNMFVRYVSDVKAHLKVGENLLKVTFTSPIEAALRRSDQYYTAPQCVPDVYHGECHANQLRKMQASFAWDWGPAFPSVGLWKPVALEYYNRAIIRTVTTHPKRKDKHWHLKVKAQLEVNPRITILRGYLRTALEVEGHEKITMAKEFETTVYYGAAEVKLNMTISENVIRLWWPNGYGDQPLYNLRVSIHTDMGYYGEDHFKELQIAFRSVKVVEEAASKRFGNTTAGNGLTFSFKVNSRHIFMKGSNWIPANILPELGSNKETVDSLLLAARDVHMSMLRVWGGGVYESDYFYQRCDQLGILIWQDLMFACSMYPADAEFLDSVRTEIEQNVLRLQHHASIAVWAGNNENEVALRGNWYGTAPQFYKYKTEYIKLYVDTIKPVVEEIDPGRRYLVSSPSNGWESEREGYIAENPYDPNYGDTHYYNYISDNWDMNIFPKTRFASEYGFQSLPSLSTMGTATREVDDYRVDSEYSKHRQHSPNGYVYIEDQIRKHLKLPNKVVQSVSSYFITSGYTRDTMLTNNSNYFEKFIFYSQITQAMAMKSETEYYRQSRADWYTMGALYWQLNDVWQAPSWSGIEYGGKWKMLHYFAKSFFAPVLVSPRLLPSGDVDVYLINDRFVPIVFGEITADIFNWNSLNPQKQEIGIANYVKPLSVKKIIMNIQIWNNNNKNNIFVRFSLKAGGVSSSPYNYVFPTPLHSIVGLKTPNIQIKVSKSIMTRGEPFAYSVEINVDTVVLFLWLETKALDGHFKDNGLIITEPYVTVEYISKTNLSPDKLEQAISYQYYMN